MRRMPAAPACAFLPAAIRYSRCLRSSVSILQAFARPKVHENTMTLSSRSPLLSRPLLSAFVHFQPEPIGTRIVPDHVQVELALRDLARIDLRPQDALPVVTWPR